MAASPLRLLRGSAQLSYADLASGALQLPLVLLSRVPPTRVMGDCHVSNFGFLTEEGAHGGTVVFCPNDYDDACVRHAAWDLARYITSLVLDEAVWEGKHWLVPSRHHARVGIDPEDIALGKQQPGERLAEHAAVCGEALALAHARGDRALNAVRGGHGGCAGRRDRCTAGPR